MDISVIIPTFRRPRKLAACVGALARQELPGLGYEVLVGVDGEDAESVRAAAGAWGDRPGLIVKECPRRGYNGAGNAVLGRARGRLMVSLNEDVVPGRGFRAAHGGAHEEAARGRGVGGGGPVIVSGYSPFVMFEGETL